MSYAQRLRGVRLKNPGLLWDEDTGYKIADDGQIVQVGAIFDEPTGYKITVDGHVVEIGSVLDTSTGYRINESGELIEIGNLFDSRTGKRIGVDGSLYESRTLFDKRIRWPDGGSPAGDSALAGGGESHGGSSDVINEDERARVPAPPEEEARHVGRAIDAREREEKHSRYEREANLRGAAREEMSEAHRCFNAGLYDQALGHANGAAALGMDTSRLITQIYISTGNTAEYLKVAETWWQFPLEIFDYLLEKKKIDTANELFNRKVKKAVVQSEVLWQVCPIGIELSEQGKQGQGWLKKFESELKEASFGYDFEVGFPRVMQLRGLSDATKEKLRDLTIAAVRKQIKIQGASFSKDLVGKAIEGGFSYDGIKGPKLFASIWAISTVVLFLKATVIGAFVAGAAVFLLASIVRTRSNSVHIAAGQLSTRLQTETAKFARVLSVGEGDVKSLLGIYVSPSYFWQTVTDLSLMTAAMLGIALLFSIIF